MIKKGLIKHEFIEKEFYLDLEWDSNPPDIVIWTQRDWDRTLLTKINMISNTIHHNTHQGGADTIRIGSEVWFLGLGCYAPSVTYEDFDRFGLVGLLMNRFKVYLDENVPYNEIWVCREQHTYGITVENTEGDMSYPRFNYGDEFDKKKLRGRIKINE